MGRQGSRLQGDDLGAVVLGVLVASVLLLLISNEFVSPAGAGMGHQLADAAGHGDITGKCAAQP
jgi:hypothetical protein